MAFITDLTAAVPTPGVYIDGLPSGVDNRQGSNRGGGKAPFHGRAPPRRLV